MKLISLEEIIIKNARWEFVFQDVFIINGPS